MIYGMCHLVYFLLMIKYIKINIKFHISSHDQFNQFMHVIYLRVM